MAKKNPKKLLLIDANSFIHRSFHALPPLEKNGKPTGAIYGLANTLLKILRDEKPDYVAACFDTPEDTFRDEMYEDYKAQRPETPDELKDQIVESYNLFENIGIKTMEKDGFEADDVIGTLAKKFKKDDDIKTIILTGDLDTLQLVEDGNIEVLTPKRGVSDMKKYDENAIKERFGIPPENLADYKGLVGDSSDNIPGVPGIGKKTAAKILGEYKTLENAIEKLEKEEDLNHRIKKLLENKEQAKLSKKLGTINQDVPLDKFNKDDIAYEDKEVNEDLIEYFDNMGFQSLVNRLKKPETLKEIKKENKKVIENAIIFTEENIEEEKLKSDKLKVTYNWKPIIKKYKDKGTEVKKPLFDIKIAGWVLDPDQKDLSLNALSKKYLNKESQLFTGEKEKKKRLKDLFTILYQKIKENNLEKVFYEIDMPLIKVLVHMENLGIKINKKRLKNLENKIDKKIKNAEKNIFKIAGEEFNINSPKQVGEILFDKLDIKAKGKTSTGQYKTSESVLNELSEDHKIAEFLLKYREFFKIKTTYIKPLLEGSDENDEIHTTFLQSSTATSRLSSENPNMQNIPKGSQWATDLRKSFEARDGFTFLSFDYSQLELRLFAHVSKDKNLVKALNEGKDIHSLTASKIFEKSIDKIDNKEREIAKTLNFGVVFGMGARAFSKQSGLSIKESRKFIDKYFEDFSDVKKWQENIKEKIQTAGMVKNENGRIRYIKSGGAMDRAAINMPIQSLGADIIKTAMNKTYNKLKEGGLLGEKARILLSIHDELLLEVQSDTLKKVAPMVKKILEKDTYELSVPLETKAKKGKNWGEMKSLKI